MTIDINLMRAHDTLVNLRSCAIGYKAAIDTDNNAWSWADASTYLYEAAPQPLDF